ncbi:caspase-6-like [Mytilus galloprovincialis]|uniref:caspase-6-like n=1 Tax=Mytilus galloprovincialis TaxID=29158 RepID=UPI003F7C48F5
MASWNKAIMESWNDKLTTAARYGDIEALKLSLQNGADIDYRDGRGVTALMNAAMFGQLEISRLLIDTGCKIDITDEYGGTAFMNAVMGGHLEICRLLIDAGCKIDIALDSGDTALHWAARRGHLQITRCLVERGASPLVTTRQGKTPYDLAAESKQRQYKEVMEYLQDRHDRYEKKPGQRGLALIVNFMFHGETSERKGSDVDCKNLTHFFKEELKYQVECTTRDMTKLELMKYFQEIVRLYLEVNSKDYHSFICVIMSHGNEDGILTTNGLITVEEIKKPFKNKSGGKFNGKPKLFLIQACRGKEEQEKVVVSDCFGTKIHTGHVGRYDEFPGNRQRRSFVETSGIKPGILDQPSASSEVFYTDAHSYSSTNVPTDADIIVAHATTPGYISFRNKYEGAFFIRAFLSVAKNKYNEEHIEEILRNVRRELAMNPEYALQSGSLAGKCQMGMLETTSTKKFFL